MSDTNSASPQLLPAEYRSAFNVVRDTRAPHSLYFFSPTDWKSGEAPPEQVALVNQFDDFADILRRRFNSQPNALEIEYGRLLELALATFNRPDPQFAVAKSALAQHKAELVHSEGGRIKSEQFKYIASAAGIAIGIIWLTAAGVRIALWYVNGWGWVTRIADEKLIVANSLQLLRPFTAIHLAVFLTGSLIGLCVSFYARNPSITFEQLRSPEADLTPPWLRVVAVTIFSLVLAILFQKRVLGISVAEIATDRLNEDAISAFLVGAFCGILGDAPLVKKVFDFATGFLGQAKSPAPRPIGG